MNYKSIFVFLFVLTLCQGIWAQSSLAPAQIQNYMSYLATANASIGGEIRVTSPTINLFSTTAARASLNRNRPISFNVSDNDMHVRTDGAITLYILGRPVRVKEINYNSRRGFKVEVETGLPFGILNDSIEAKARTELQKRFGEKMQQAFARIRLLKQQRNIGDAQSVFNSIIQIFNSGSPTTSALGRASIAGSIGVYIYPDRARTLDVGNFKMDIPARASVTAGITFSRVNRRFSISGMEASSSQPIRFRPARSSKDTLSSVDVSSIRIGANGFEGVYITGPEGAVGGLRWVLSSVLAYSSAGSMGLPPNCDQDMRIRAIQAAVNERVRAQLRISIREHRTALLRAGVEAAVLNALD